MKKHYIAPGCFFEPAEDEEVVDPVIGVNKGSIAFGDSFYRRHSMLDDIPDNFEARMRNFKRSEVRTEEREVKTPDGFAVSIAYNKSGYQLIPKDDL